MGECKRCTRACVDCGKTMHDIYPTKLRCPECASRHHKELSARWREKNRIIGRRPESPKKRVQNAEQRDFDFRSDCRAADKLGISYGQYMLQKMQESKRPTGEATADGPGE